MNQRFYFPRRILYYLLDSQTESSKKCFVKVVSDSQNYLHTKWFVLVPNISLAAIATAAPLDGNPMVFELSDSQLKVLCRYSDTNIR